MNEKETNKSDLPFENSKMNNLQRIVEVRTEFKRYENLEHYKISTKVLTFICMVLISCLFIFAILYGLKWPVIYCETDECIRSAAYLKLSMNSNVDPCRDFFEYTCGKWSREHPLFPGYKSFSKFGDVARRINKAAQEFLSRKDDINDISPVKQSRMFYRSCLDRKSMEALGFTTIFEYLEKVDLPIVPTLFNNETIGDYTFDWKRTVSKLRKISSMEAFLSLNVLRNRFDTSESLMYIGRPATRCSTESEKKVFKKHEKILKYVVGQIIHNVTNEIPSEESLDEAVNIIKNITDYICRNRGTKTRPRSPYHQSYKFHELQEEIDHHTIKEINRTEPRFLETFVGLIFDGIEGVTIDFQRDLLYVRGTTNKPYLLDILTFIYSTPETHIEFYLWWLIVEPMARYTHLDHFIRHTVNPHRRTKNLSKRALEPYCVREVSSKMHFAVTYGVAEKGFQTSTGQKVKLMVDQLKEELRERIRTTDWLDETTRASNLEKLEYSTSFIGIPEWLFEKGQLEQFYRNIEIKSTTYLHNTLQIIELESIKHYEALRNRRGKKEEFPHNPLTANAYNMFQINAIVLPLAILTFPMYDLGIDVLNYGVIGFLMGHELTHTYDTRGVQYNKYGNYGQWWSEKSTAIFNKKTRCFVEQYNNLTIQGVKAKVSGWKTRGENIADNGGLSIAYRAFKKNEIGKSEVEKLPGFEDFTTSQLFFIAVGSTWCHTSTRGHQEYLMKNDVHSPGSVRVNVLMQNSIEFAEAFSCPRSSNMNPINKCKIW